MLGESRMALCGSTLAMFLVCSTGLAQNTANPPQPPNAPPMTAAAQGVEGAKKLMTQQLAWDVSSTTGAKLIAKERSRAKGEQATVIRYDLITQGLPRDQHYTLVTWPLNGAITPVEGGISLTEDGRLICTGKTKADCAPSRPDADPIIDLALTAAKGEPKRFGVISDDQKWKALTTLVAFPDVGTDGGCTLEALRVTPEAEAMMVRGKGFTPRLTVPMTSDSAGEIVTGSWQINEKGELISLVMPAVRGKTEGQATIRVKAPECAPQVVFRWGKGSSHPE
jgi:hypothetical protein